MAGHKITSAAEEWGAGDVKWKPEGDRKPGRSAENWKSCRLRTNFIEAVLDGRVGSRFSLKPKFQFNK